MTEEKLRQNLIQHARLLNDSGLTQGNSGNISVRCEGGLLITPTGIPYHQLEALDLVKLNLSGDIIEGDKLPSSEWHFHCAIMKARSDTNAIVHTHSTHCTALACTGRDIPAFHYMVAVAGGKNIRCAAYATYGTEQLADNAVSALENRTACLLANHGSLALGTSISKAFQLAQSIEELAKQYCDVLKIGEAKILSDQEMNAVLEKFSSYGQQENDSNNQVPI
jgi:L-fuculose-phosphate aldolase